MEYGKIHSTDAGTPQGGIISPLLANIALHGMEEALTIRKNGRRAGKTTISKDGIKYNNWGESIGSLQIVRYAEDFVVFSDTREKAEKVVEILTEWLKPRGLTLSKEKTKIVHLTERFNFLGFNIRHYKDNKTKTGWKLLIKPSREKVQEIKEELKRRWLEMKSYGVDVVISTLNPYIRGVANYLRPMVSSRAFSSLDNYMYCRERRYVTRMHNNKSIKWRTEKYWGRLNLDRNDRWVFGDKRTGRYLLKFKWYNIIRHIMVKGDASPDNPSLRKYWKDREKAKAVMELGPSNQKIAKRQEYTCPVCGQTLFNEEELHRHHIKPRKKGGKDNIANLQLVHLYCHQNIHSQPDKEAGQVRNLSRG